MTYSWMNEDGEPIMDGAAWRFEQALDSEYANERAYADYDEPDYDECDECGEYSVHTTTGE